MMVAWLKGAAATRARAHPSRFLESFILNPPILELPYYVS
jgi:hypothetical protein